MYQLTNCIVYNHLRRGKLSRTIFKRYVDGDASREEDHGSNSEGCEEGKLQGSKRIKLQQGSVGRQ